MTETMQRKAPTMYCPKCATRYASGAGECVTCHVSLVDKQPHESLFRPKVDIPVALLSVAFLATYSTLPGEAQSFGVIALVVGLTALVVFRFIGYSEWLGRR